MSDARVVDCAVLGIEDDRLGERVVAAVQLVRGTAADEQQLLDSCRANLARYKVPDRIVFVDDFPRSPMGKILKRELGALFGRTKRESS